MKSGSNVLTHSLVFLRLQDNTYYGYVFFRIRKGPIVEDIEQNYAEGLPSLYLRECVRIFISHLTNII